MGLLRIFLALSVFFAHTMPQVTSFINARYAVQIFFMVSGFLISHVLITNQNYRNNYRNFYINRFIKIYPIYYLILFSTIFFFVINNKNSFPWKTYFLDTFTGATLNWKLFIVFINTTLLGIDTTGWLNIPGIILVNSLMIPPAWSLGLEILFYLLAPFIVYSWRRTLIVCIVSAFIKCYVLTQGDSFYRQWVTPFFPAELSFFVLGALSYQLLYPLYVKFSADEKKFFSLVILTITCVISIGCLGIFTNLKNYSVLLYIVFIFFSLPATFIFSRAFKWDRFVGEISFPLYLVHILLFNEIDYIFRIYFPHYYFPQSIPFITLVASLLISLVIVLFVFPKLEILRMKRKEKSAEELLIQINHETCIPLNNIEKTLSTK